MLFEQKPYHSQRTQRVLRGMDIRRHFLHVRANSTKRADLISQSRRYGVAHPGNSREKNIPLRKA